MAYFANYNLFFPLPERVNPPPIEPEMSNIITEFNSLSSLGSPSSFPLINNAKNSFILLSSELEGLDALQNPMCRSAILSVFGPT